MDEAFIISYLKGETTDQENKDLEIWLNESNENLAMFKDWQKIWLLSVKQNTPLVSAKEAWQKIDQRTQLEPKQIQMPIFKWKYAAAIILLLIVAGLWLSQWNNAVINWQATDQVTLRTLPDGTKVWLSPGSRLTYPEKFEVTIREVRLHGKAYFDVTEDPDKPFLVTGAETQIKVLGTEFMAVSTTNVEQVLLESGKVAFYKQADVSQKVILDPAEMAVLDRQSGKVVKSVEKNQNLLAWKTKRLVFENTQLYEVFKLLEEVYGIHIEAVENTYKACLITATFNQEPIENVWELLDTLFLLKVSAKNENTYLVTGKGCNDQ
ncbi:MAG: FecR domain-containing protein [Bacteroidota bacterium]